MKAKNFEAEAIKRLRGAWQSDRAKTMSYCVFPKRIATKNLKAWAEMFGKMKWRITAARIYTEYEGRKSIFPYKILWANQWSAVLLIGKGEEAKARHLFFDGDYFYVLAARSTCEYFKRMPSR